MKAKVSYASLLDLDPMLLPSVKSDSLVELPSVSGIYFVLVDDVVVYIGKSLNLKVRWNDFEHHVLPQLPKSFLVSWLAVNKTALGFVELLLIELHEPELNKSQTLNGSKGLFSESDLLDAFYLGYNKGLLQGLKMGKSSVNDSVIRVLSSKKQVTHLNPLTVFEISGEISAIHSANWIKSESGDIAHCLHCGGSDLKTIESGKRYQCKGCTKRFVTSKVIWK